MEEVLRTLARSLKGFELGETEIRIYSLLQRESLTPRQIAKILGLSERTVREKLKHLLELGLIERTLVNRGWLGYIYRAKDPREALNRLFNRIEAVIKSIEEEAAEKVRN